MDEDIESAAGGMGVSSNSQASKQLTQAQLYKKQQQMGNIAAGIAGVGSLAAQDVGMAQSAKSINVNAPAGVTDAFGRPSYNLGDFAQQSGAIVPRGSNFGERLSGTLQGASTGYKIGGPIGAGVGAAAGLVGSIIGGAARKRAQAKRKRLATANLGAANNLYNTGVAQANNQQMAQDSYNYYRNNATTRTNNIYNANTPQ